MSQCSASCSVICAVAAIFASACGGGSQPAAAPAPAAPPARSEVSVNCPDDLSLTLAFPVQVAPDKPPVWLVHDRLVEAARDDLFPSQQAHGVKQLSAEEAQRHGVQPRDATLWVFSRDEAPPCVMRATQAWAVHQADGPSWTRIAWALEGACDLPPEVNGQHRLAFWSKSEHAACRMHAVGSIARDAQGAGTPVLPSDVKAVLPDASCSEPGCFRWTWDGIGLTSGAAVYEVAAAWLHPPKGDEPACAAPYDKFHGVFIRSCVNTPWQVVEGAAGLSNVVYDTRGLRAVATDDDGVLSTWLPTEGAPMLRRTIENRYAIVNEEEPSKAEQLWPSCL